MNGVIQITPKTYFLKIEQQNSLMFKRNLYQLLIFRYETLIQFSQQNFYKVLFKLKFRYLKTK